MDDEMDEATKEFLKREQEILGADAALFGNPMGDAPAETSAPFPEFESGTFDQAEHNVLDQNMFEPLAPSMFEAKNFEASKPVVESEALKAWSLEFEKEILERDQKQAEKHIRIHNEAKEQLDKFYAEYSQKKFKQQEGKRGEKSEEGNVWERVYKQVQVKKEKLVKKEKGEKIIKDEKKGNTDLTRFKNLLTSLKNDRKAPGLAV
jgi:uncharacterized caspase-like protein